MPPGARPGRIEVAVIGRPHGVRGLVHVHAYCADPADLPRYAPLEDERGRLFMLTWTGGAGIARLAELRDGQEVPVADRDAAAALVNLRLLVPRERLPAPAAEEFYIADLVGLEAVAPDGSPLGRVAAVHEYGAGASLEIGARIVPFTRAAVPAVDLAAGRVTIVAPVEVVGEAGR